MDHTLDNCMIMNNYSYISNYMSVTKMAGEYNLLIIILNQDYTEEDE
jgi:hypothetical protein